MLGRAIAINPVFAAAHACIAVTHVNDYINGWAEIPERSLQTGLEIAARVILMDDEDPYAHGWFAVRLCFGIGSTTGLLPQHGDDRSCADDARGEPTLPFARRPKPRRHCSGAPLLQAAGADDLARRSHSKP